MYYNALNKKEVACYLNNWLNMGIVSDSTSIHCSSHYSCPSSKKNEGTSRRPTKPRAMAKSVANAIRPFEIFEMTLIVGVISRVFTNPITIRCLMDENKWQCTLKY